VLRLFRGLWYRRAKSSFAPAPDALSTIADADQRIETRLLTILEMVNEWLQFAEAKNAGLVALDALGLAAILTYLPAADTPSPLAGGLVAASFLLLLSLGTSLWSFLPRSDTGKLVPTTDQSRRNSDNLYFYGDICGYRPEQLAAAIARRYEKVPDYEPAQHESHVDLASQIVANSRITVTKNGYFRVATMIAMLALLAAALGLVISLVPFR
jgi:hypothetical protein